MLVTGCCVGMLLGLVGWAALLTWLDARATRLKKSKALEADCSWTKEGDAVDRDVKREARRVLRAMRAANEARGVEQHAARSNNGAAARRPDLDDFVVAADLKKSYGAGAQRKLAVRGVSLGIKPGECLGLLGANGAGKSTFIGLLSGQLAPDDGESNIFF